LVVEQEGWTVDGHRTDATIIVSGRDVTIFDRHGFRFQQADPLAIDAAASSSADTVEAPMPGLVKSVSVSVGDSVKSGQSLCVLEAMKMEHSLTAPRDGVVETVGCQTGDQVQSGSTLLMLEPIE
jgi:3-methylcrotonyl-CoA carboxylase alpha subunit